VPMADILADSRTFIKRQDPGDQRQPAGHLRSVD
jgi:hypothetical protein